MTQPSRTGTYAIFSTVGSLEAAEAVAEALVAERLVACVNIVPGLRSIYRWKGETVRDDEVLLILKTTAHRYREVEERVRALHPYEVPEILALEAEAGFGGYLDWVGESVDEG